jgi:acyl carrier protein
MLMTHHLSEDVVKTRVRQFVIDSFLFGQDSQSLSDNDSFLDRGIVDSTGVLELVSFLETQFNVSVDNHELIPDNLDSINRVTTFVSAKLSGSQSQRNS